METIIFEPDEFIEFKRLLTLYVKLRHWYIPDRLAMWITVRSADLKGYIMARNRIGPKKVKRLRQQTGLPVLTALTRGDTDHRIDLCLDDGSVVHLFRDGTTEKAKNLTWDVRDWLASQEGQSS